MLEEIFKKTIEKYDLVKKNDRIVVGVSGGPDSMCLLYMLSEIRKTYKLQLACAHFNHSLRPEADDEERFVKKHCQALHIVCMTAKKDVHKFFDGDSLEQTARHLRQDFFLHCTREFKAKKVALAHNKDDVAETVLMRMIRGSALRGLRGIMPKSKLKRVTLIRPLLEARKKIILDWLDQHRVEYRIDKSNLEDKFFRNKIRLTLLPLLQEYNPSIVNSLCNLSQTVALDYDFLHSQAEGVFNALRKQRGSNYIRLETKELKTLHPSLFFTVLTIAIEEVKGNTRKLELRHFQEIADLLHHRPVFSIVDLPDLEVKKEERWLSIKSLFFR